MRFAKRQVKSVQISCKTEMIYNVNADAATMVAVFAHEAEVTASQLLGIEIVNKVTGEVTTQRINLPIEDMYIVSITEILEIQE